jgi:hypothetical protein
MAVVRKRVLAILGIGLMMYTGIAVILTVAVDKSADAPALLAQILQRRSSVQEDIAVLPRAHRASELPIAPPSAPPTFAQSAQPSAAASASERVHCMYYGWYGTPATDGRYYHWDHELIPHWNADTAARFPRGKHRGGDDVGADFFPQPGAYSSRNESLVRLHMSQLNEAACGVLVVSWYPPGMADGQGQRGGADAGMAVLFAAAAEAGLQIAFHLEPYTGRSAQTVRRDCEYIQRTYGHHPALFQGPRTARLGTSSRSTPSDTADGDHRTWRGPWIYVYDSYLSAPAEWAELLTPTGAHSVRGTAFDGTFISLVVEEAHLSGATTGGFDGIYTYFASPISFGATQANWPALRSYCTAHGLIFVPCVGPGYADTRVRPWNAGSSRARQGGAYYEAGWRAAAEAHPDIVGVTSFNEWHEGTQIEPAVPFTASDGFEYLDYRPHQPSHYLVLTRRFAALFDPAVPQHQTS